MQQLALFAVAPPLFHDTNGSRTDTCSIVMDSSSVSLISSNVSADMIAKQLFSKAAAAGYSQQAARMISTHSL